ncbi:MAG TPA: hypothetical protein VM055_02710 [Novosphingobium sp.]|nr:hypothetical protein [Novosphingobium sp.]
MRTRVVAGVAGLALMAALSAQPCLAQTAVDPANVTAEDVAMSPFADVGLSKKAIPVVLKTAMARPYDLTGIKSCVGFTTAIMDLDVALGADIDVAFGKTADEKMGNSAGAVAKSVIGSFIPFRGVIRELSGANAHQREWDRALYAGAARRAFLKGMGEQRGCAYPARSATPEVVAALTAERTKRKAKTPPENTAGEPVKVSFETTPAAPLKGSR